MDTPILVDFVRGAHLLCVVLGMGPALYFDIRALSKIGQPITIHDQEELRRIHRVVTLACLGLWITGCTLIWQQTHFDAAAFSAKLWLKLLVVSALTANAAALHFWVLPVFMRSTGRRVIELPLATLMPMTISAGFSLACWGLALALGASALLKTAAWSVLLPVAGAWVIACIAGTVSMTLVGRNRLRAT